MKKLLFSLFGAMLVLCATNTHAQVKRAMWVWHTNDIINNVSGARQTLFDFCAEPPGSQDALTVPESSQPISLLYFYAHSYVNGDSTKKARLRSFLRDAHAEGIEVEFLDGAADWATTGKSYALNYLNYALAFNAGASSADEKFDGIQYDVEPYLLANWFTTDIWNSFIDLVTKCQYKVDSVGGLRFGVAIPRWYDSNPGRTYLVQLQSKVDYVAVMNYTDKATNMINDAANEIKIADSLGKKVVLGSETLQIEPISITFAEEGWSNMEARLYAVVKKYENNSSFAGIAIHEYDPYKTLSKYGTGGVDLTAPYTVGIRHNWSSGNGAINLTVADICGSGVSATSSTALSKVSLNGTLLSGSWSSTGSTLSFAPSSSLDAGGTAKVIYTPTDLSANMRRDTLTFDIAGVPLAVSPASGASNQASAVSVKWNRSKNATAYTLQVSTSSSFTNLAIDTLLTDTTFTISSIPDSTTLHWRVKGKSLYSETKPSTARSFSTGTTPLYAGDTSTGGGSTGGSTKGGKGGKTRKTTLTASFQPTEAALTTFDLASYPNPAIDFVTVAVEAVASGEATFDLLDASGRSVIVQRSLQLKQVGNVVHLDLGDLPSGSYFLRVSTGSEIKTQTIQVIK